MKKLASLLLAVVLAAGLALPAFAAEGDTETITVPVSELVQDTMPVDQIEVSHTDVAPTGEYDIMPINEEIPDDLPLLIAPNPNALGSYGYTLVVNGETVDTSTYPEAEGIPMAALAQADYGNTYFDEEAKVDTGYFEGSSIDVNTANGEVTVTGSDDTAAKFTGASYVGGYTFLPLEAVNAMAGYTATLNGTTIEVATPNGTELVKLAHKILEAADIGYSMKMELGLMMENYDVDMANIEEGYFFGGMMTTPDCLIIAKLAEGADVENVRAGFEAHRQSQHDTFSWYLSQNLPKVEAAKLVIKNGYAMLLIAPDSDAGLAIFNAAFPTDTYTVQKGDTLGFITTNFYGSNAKRNALYKANKEAFKATKGKLLPGMVLTLPEKLGKVARIEPAVAGAGEKLYTVKLGDTLGKISKAEFGSMSFAKAIFERNNDRLKNMNTIYEGQIIVLPEVKSITVNVVGKDGKTTAFNYKTTDKTLADVLLANKLVKGTVDEYGLYIETVNGVTADWATDGAWWAIKENGEESMTGASGIQLADGATYELVYTVNETTPTPAA